MVGQKTVYSIQRAYILKFILTPEKVAFTCDERMDIPTIEPLSNVEPVLYEGQPLSVIPCIELVGEFLSEFNLTFETNEGVTVLPIEIASGQDNPLENPYMHFRYVLVLPRGATGVKSCKIIHKDFGQEVQHNLTFGIMPPPYNYDNVLFGYLMYNSITIAENLQERLKNLKITGKIYYSPIPLPKGVGKQTVTIEPYQRFFDVLFSYPLSSEPTIHKPKITLHSSYSDPVYTLSLNKTANIVTIDLLTGRITAYDRVNGEIIQQFMLDNSIDFKSISFENFADIDTSSLKVSPRGVRVG